MANDGLMTPDFDEASSLDFVLGNRQVAPGVSNTVQVPVASLAAQVTAEMEIIAGTGFETWTELAAHPGTTAGQLAKSFEATGEHLDPVTLVMVPNGGNFRWSTSPAGWRRLGNLVDPAVQTLSTTLQSAVDSFEGIAICRVDGIYRPGDAPGMFSADISGAPEAMAPLPASGVASSADGRSYRITGAGKVILRPTIWLKDGRSWKCRTIYKRVTDPSDPLGDAVRTVVYWLDSSFNLITSVNVITDPGALVANGARSNTFALPTPPGGAVFARLGVQMFGGDGVTDVQEGALEDITEAIALLETPYDGLWNASTNTPTLVSGVGVKGHYRIVSVAGSTTIDGTSSWAINDRIIFNGTVWEKIPDSTTINDAMMSAWLNTLPTDPAPLASGIWWNNSGIPNRTP